MSDEEKKAVERFWLEKWPDDKKQYHWSAKGLNVLEETLDFAEAYGAECERRGMEKAAQRISHMSCGCAHVIRSEISGETK